MSKLLSYSIETDQTVLLQFVDASERRVPIDRLCDFVQGDDLHRIKGALKVRETFLKRHLPKLGLTVAVGGLLGLGTLTHQEQIRTLMHNLPAPSSSSRQPGQLDSAATLATPTPSSIPAAVLGATATPQPTPSPSTTARRPKSKSSQAKPSPSDVPTSGFKIHLPSL